MSQGRSSLLSDTGFDAIGAKGSKSKNKQGLDSMAMLKLGGGAVALLVGVFLILRSLGMFSGAPQHPTMSPTDTTTEENRRIEERQQLEIETNNPISGA